jgi:hypothetical protein
MLFTLGSPVLFGLFCIELVLAGCSDKFLTAESPKTIHKDVVVIGGGASGAYSAVRLREDFGLRVAVVEKEAQLVRFSMRDLRLKH